MLRSMIRERFKKTTYEDPSRQIQTIDYCNQKILQICKSRPTSECCLFYRHTAKMSNTDERKQWLFRKILSPKRRRLTMVAGKKCSSR